MGLRDNLILPAFYVCYSLLVLIFYALFGTLDTNHNLSVFGASATTPWGVITAVIFSFSTTAMISNVAAIVTLSILLSIIIDALGKALTKAAIVMPFIISTGILSAQIILRPTEYAFLLGNSGISYSLAGMLACVSLIFIVTRLTRIWRGEQKGALGRRDKLALGLSAFLLMIVLSGIFIFPALFFVIMPRIYYEGHMLAFGLGILGMIVAYSITKRKKIQ